MELVIPKQEDLPACARAYCSAYSVPPWNEAYDETEIVPYIASYLDSETLCCYALAEGSEIVGVVLGILVPSVGESYLRIEDFCIAEGYQKRGYGSMMMQMLAERMKQRGCADILLGTQRGYPSHRFYLKQGFVEVESVLMVREG